MRVLHEGYDEKTGVYQDGAEFLAIGGYESKPFKTEKGALRWATKRGIVK